MMKKNRPMGVTVLGVLQVLVGLGSLGLGFFLASTYAFLASVVGGAGGSSTAGIAVAGGLFGGVLMILGMIMGVVMIVIGMVSLVIAYGLFKGASWAWMLCLVLSVISAVFGVLTFPPGIVTIIFNGLIIYYLTRRYVKEYFGRIV